MDIFFHQTEILIFLSISVNHFNENLKLLRTAWGLSQTVMAKRYSVSQSSYGRWEVDTEPRLDVLLELAEFFKVPFGDFITKKLEPKDIPPRWGMSKEYLKQPDETQLDTVEEASTEEVAALVQELRKVVAALAKLEAKLEKVEAEQLVLQRQVASLGEAVDGK